MTEEKFESLIQEYNDQRQALKGMILDLEALRQKIDKLFPQSIDARYAKLFEEKIKTTTELFKAILEMRKELSKSVKEEIELRRKFESDIKESDEEVIVDVRSLAKQIEAINKAERKSEVLSKTIQGFEKAVSA
jgi:hypothetical protein